MKYFVLWIVALSFVFANTVIAADPSAQISARDAQGANVKKAATHTIQKMPTLKPGIVKGPEFKMTCPNANEISLHLFNVDTNWVVEPSFVNPNAFASANANMDKNDKTKVTLVCHYNVVMDYITKHPYNGLQSCPCNRSTGEGNIRFKKPEGYTTNPAGTSASGFIPMKKTGEKIQNQMIECQFHVDGQAHLYKQYQAPFSVSTCQANGREVTCQ